MTRNVDRRPREGWDILRDKQRVAIGVDLLLNTGRALLLRVSTSTRAMLIG